MVTHQRGAVKIGGQEHVGGIAIDRDRRHTVTFVHTIAYTSVHHKDTKGTKALCIFVVSLRAVQDVMSHLLGQHGLRTVRTDAISFALPAMSCAWSPGTRACALRDKCAYHDRSVR